MKINLKRKFLLLLTLFLTLFIVTACDNKNKNIELEYPTIEDEVELDTRYTDELDLQQPFKGKKFEVDGIEEVEVVKVIDGDTIVVRSLSENVRFLGVDTPECTGTIEPWGFAAANFVRERLFSAESVVLQSEGELTDHYGRYLAWVWYKPVNSGKYRLLNLELIENALSKFTFGDTIYYDIFIKAHEKTEITEQGVFGDKNDPNYEYNRTPVQITIFEALENHDKYKLGTVFKFKAQVVRIVSESFFVRDVDVEDPSKVGHIYVYSGVGANYSNYLNPGDIITFEAQLQYEGQFGTQLTGIKRVAKVGTQEIELLEFDGNDLKDGGLGLKPYYGQVIKVINLTLVNIRRSQNDLKKNYYSLEFKNDRGEIISVRLAASKSQYRSEELVIGKKYSVIGGVSSYEYATNYYQIVVGEKNKTLIPDLLMTDPL